MKFFIRTARYTLLDHKRNEQTLEEQKVETVDDKLRRRKSNWFRYVTSMNSNRMLTIMLTYTRRPNGPRRSGRRLKKLIDEVETGLSRPNSSRMIMNNSVSMQQFCSTQIQTHSCTNTVAVKVNLCLLDRSDFSRRASDSYDRVVCRNKKLFCKANINYNLFSPLNYLLIIY